MKLSGERERKIFHR